MAQPLRVLARRRGLGVLYLVVLVALITLSVLVYNKAFTKVVLVTLKTDHTGNQLMYESDVKVRGIIVGSVREVKVTSGDACLSHTLTCVNVTLALQPDRVKLIPKNVSAQILPKTLFGEQYVSLRLPDEPRGSLASGDVIAQDRSQGALETEKVLGDLLPVLQAVSPADLNATLTAMATALKGRGEQLGKTLVGMDQYLQAFNPHTSALIDDFKRLGEVALEYNDVAPDIFATLQNLQTSVQTITEKRAQLSNLMTSVTDTSGLLRSFLAENEQRLISVVGSTDKVYARLAEYSPEFGCLLNGLNKLQELGNSMIDNHQIKLSIVFDTAGLGKYTPGQEPVLLTGYGPNCFGLPNPVKPFPIPDKYKCLNDGAPLTDAPCGATRTRSADLEAIGSAPENALVNTLIAPSLGVSPDRVPPIATALAAPMLRGSVVEVSDG